MLLVRDVGGSSIPQLPHPDPSVVQIVECDDLYSTPAAPYSSSSSRSSSAQNDPMPHPHPDVCSMTDGAGRISIDLMCGIPPIDNGRVLESCRPMNAEESAPLSMQARLWYGSVAKGQWVVDATLPPRTITVSRQSQRKLQSTTDEDVHGTWSLEVIRTWDRPKRVRLDVYLIPLLEASVGSRVAELHDMVLELQRSEAAKLLAMSDKQLGKAVQRQATMQVLEAREKTKLLDLVRAGFDPLTEPFLQLELAKMKEEALASLKAGKLALPDSHTLVGHPDFTGSLRPGEVCILLHGKQLPRPSELRSDELFQVLVYGSPGMHPGDIRKLSVVYPEKLLDTIRGVDPARMHSIFFSTLGERPEADRIAGKDYDGDAFSVIGWQKIVRLFIEQAPYNPIAATDAFEKQKSKVTGKRKVADSSTGMLYAESSGLVAAGAQQAEQEPAASLLGDHLDDGRTASQASAGVEQRLLANFLMARFLGAGSVGTAGTQWMVFADKYGAYSRQCLMLDHLYRTGLDASPPDVQYPSAYGDSVPTYLISYDYPEHMQYKAEMRNERAQRMGSKGVEIVPSHRPTLLAQLWNAMLVSPAGKLTGIYLDHHLSCNIWQSSSATIDETFYVKKWEKYYKEYSERERALRTGRTPEAPIAKEDPYWEQHRMLVDDFRTRLLSSHTAWERLMAPQELYAEVAGLYEACYSVARYQQQRRMSEQVQQHMPDEGESGQNGPPFRQAYPSRIKFPWWIASKELREMKEKAAELEREGVLPHP